MQIPLKEPHRKRSTAVLMGLCLNPGNESSRTLPRGTFRVPAKNLARTHARRRGNFINCNFVVVLGLNRESTSSWHCSRIGQPERPHSAREIYKLPINLPLCKLNGDCSLCTGHVSHLIRHRRGSRLSAPNESESDFIERGLCNCAMNARCWGNFRFLMISAPPNVIHA